MKILLTGSSGFIGRNFINLYKNKYKIKSFSYAESKAEDADLSGIDTVIHLGALVHNMSELAFSEYEHHNVKKSVELANLAKKSGIKHFVFMSTIKVYGDMVNDRCFDEKTVCAPSDNYGKSKFLAEKELLKLADDNFKISIIRTPVVYGAGVKANILSLIKLVDKLPLLPFANIDNKRNFVYVENLCALIDKIIEVEKTDIYLAADGEAISTSDLIMMIQKSLNKKQLFFSFSFLNIIIKKFALGIYERLYGNLCLNSISTCRKLNFKAPFSTQEGIKKTVQWYINDNK